MRERLICVLAIPLLFLGTAGLVSCSALGRARSAGANVPTARVAEGNVQLEVHATGELRATRSPTISAPAIAGGSLGIIHLLKSGSPVKPGDVVVAFDPSEQEYNLAQSRSDLDQAEQEITKAKDDAAVQAAEDQTALLKTQFDVRRAQLEASKNPLLSAIDAKKNLLALDEANRALAQLRLDIQSHAASGQASVGLNQQKADKARLAMDQARKNIENMRVRSPLEGLVVVRQNFNSTGGFFFTGMTVPEYQEGDQVNPGNIIAEVVEIDRMEVAAKVSEADRANVRPGQQVEIRIDALPDRTFSGRVKSVAGMPASGFFEANRQREVDVTIQLDSGDPALRPGFTAHLLILVDRLPRALTIPREAVFDRGGKPTVYLVTGAGFVPRAIQIRFLTEARAVIAGLKPGDEVALLPPGQGAAASDHTPVGAGTP